TATQVLVVADAERVVRGLPAMTESAPLDLLAQQGVAAGVDPTGPAGYTWGSNWIEGHSTALTADFEWMYDDGLGSFNVDCAASDPSGCWLHRHNILMSGSGHSGAGDRILTAGSNGVSELTELFVQGYP